MNNISDAPYHVPFGQCNFLTECDLLKLVADPAPYDLYACGELEHTTVVRDVFIALSAVIFVVGTIWSIVVFVLVSTDSVVEQAVPPLISPIYVTATFAPFIFWSFALISLSKNRSAKARGKKQWLVASMWLDMVYCLVAVPITMAWVLDDAYLCELRYGGDENLCFLMPLLVGIGVCVPLAVRCCCMAAIEIILMKKIVKETGNDYSQLKSDENNF